jgi:hypothetical protein
MPNTTSGGHNPTLISVQTPQTFVNYVCDLNEFTGYLNSPLHIINQQTHLNAQRSGLLAKEANGAFGIKVLM